MSEANSLSGRIELAHVRAALAGSDPRPVAPFPHEVSAAVAIVLAEGPGGLDLLLIRRATRADDPWSGHMGLPGGRWEPDDGLLWRTAVRETLEETGIDLDAAELLGRLEPIAAVAHGRRVGISIVPFVFALGARAACTPSEEVEEAFWTPLEPLYLGQLDTGIEFDRDGAITRLNAWDVEGRIVWGLTHAMVDELLHRIRALPGAPAVAG